MNELKTKRICNQVTKKKINCNNISEEQRSLKYKNSVAIERDKFQDGSKTKLASKYGYGINRWKCSTFPIVCFRSL